MVACCAPCGWHKRDAPMLFLATDRHHQRVGVLLRHVLLMCVTHVLPDKTIGTDSTMRPIPHAAGDNTASCVYSDFGAGVVGACDEMGILSDHRSPKCIIHGLTRTRNWIMCGWCSDSSCDCGRAYVSLVADWQSLCIVRTYHRPTPKR